VADLTAGVPGVLDPALRDRPDAPAVVTRSGALTYAELDRAADRAAAALWAAGARPGSRVAASLPNDFDVVVAFHGAMRIGAVWVGINAALAPPEKQALLDDCAPTVVLASRDALSTLSTAAQTVDGATWRSLMAGAPTAAAVAVDVHAPAGIAYTSGTTGLPKGIVHSQHNLLLPGAVLVATRGYGPGLVKGDCLPLTVLNLQVLTSLLTAQAQGCCVVMDRRDLAGILGWVQRCGVTVWNAVPPQLHDLVRSGASLGGLKELWSGGGDCPDGLRADVLAGTGLPVRATYGLTEAPTVVSIDPAGEASRPGTSGQVLPHLQVRSVGEDGRPLPRGAIGELSISATASGPWAGAWTPMLGTWAGGEVVAPATTHLGTGDLGSVDGEGWLRVVDRQSLVVIRGGANVYPAEVERVLMAAPGVLGAAVCGLPDERLGERVGAVVELAPGNGLEAVRAICTERLAGYKVPEVWVIAALPRNAMGKVIRSALPGLLLEGQR
jgi:long-chain acyl-CoA synthetase